MPNEERWRLLLLVLLLLFLMGAFVGARPRPPDNGPLPPGDGLPPPGDGIPPGCPPECACVICCPPTDGAPPPEPPPPVPPPMVPEFRNIVCSFSDTSVPATQDGRVVLSVVGEHKGPATFVQALLGADHPALMGEEAVSDVTAVPTSSNFVAFGPIVTGPFRWRASEFPPGTMFNLLGRLRETDAQGTAFGDVASCNQELSITSIECPELAMRFRPESVPFDQDAGVWFDFGYRCLGEPGQFLQPVATVFRPDGRVLGTRTFTAQELPHSRSGSGRIAEISANSFRPGEMLRRSGILFETDGQGNRLSIVASISDALEITGVSIPPAPPPPGPSCILDNNRAEIMVTDATGTRPLVRVGEPDQVVINDRTDPFRIVWPVRNLGSERRDVHLQITCHEEVAGVVRPASDTIVGPPFLVAGGQEVVIGSGPIVLANFNCFDATIYRLQMRSDDPACPQVGQTVSFRVAIFQLGARRPARSGALSARAYPDRAMVRGGRSY